MPYHGFPGDEEANRQWHRKVFDDSYGANADAKSLFLVQPIWLRFAVLFPRVAFLLDSLNWIYNLMDVALVEFHSACMIHDVGFDAQRIAAPLNKRWDPFEYFNNYANEMEQRTCWLHLRTIVRTTKSTPSEYLFRERAYDVIDSMRAEDRKALVEELMSIEVARDLHWVPVDMDKGIWAVRRQIMERETALENAMKRLHEALEAPAIKNDLRQVGFSPRFGPSYSTQDEVEYGATPITSVGEQGRTARFSRSPPRSISPQHRPRGRRHSFQNRSISRDSTASSVAPSSVVTWAPEEPDHFTLSMRVWSTSMDEWVESIAIMDTGCEGGNFVSSVFLEEHLDMLSEIEEDPDADKMQLVDFGGKTDFKPLGKVKLRWYGRNIQSGKKGKRTIQAEDWFKVAPHIQSESGEEPFQILLGKDWLHDNEVFTYRGLRLFRSKHKKTQGISPQHRAILQHREQLRHEAEMERISERLASDNVSLSTGQTSQSPKSSALSLSSVSTGLSSQANGVMHGPVSSMPTLSPIQSISA